MRNLRKTLPLLAIAAAAVVAAPTLALADDHDWHDHRDARVDEHERDRGAGHAHWHRGDRVSEEYRGPRYEVRDWRAHHLNEPPAGYHWVQVDGDFVLAAVATGVIADVLLTR